MSEPDLPEKVRRVSCWPRTSIELMEPPAKALLISVYDRSDGPLFDVKGWQEVLRLRFHDTDGSQMGLEVFSDAQAQKILAFLERNADCEHIYVHCAAGQSRSAGIALVLGEALGVPAFRKDSPLRANDPFYNRKVYRTLHNAICEKYYDPK